MSNIKKKIKIRQGHRAYLTKILGNADDNVQNYDGNQEKKLKQIRITLKERLDTLKTLDEEILELIEADEEISTEIEEAGKYRESVHEIIVNIDSVLEAKPINDYVYEYERVTATIYTRTLSTDNKTCEVAKTYSKTI